METRLVEAVEESIGSILAGLVLILIEGDLDTAIGVFAQLGQLRRSQVGANGTGGIAVSRLPQHGQIEQPFDQDHVAVSRVVAIREPDLTLSRPDFVSERYGDISTVGRRILSRVCELWALTTVRLKVEENQLVDVFDEIGTCIEGLKGA